MEASSTAAAAEQGIGGLLQYGAVGVLAAAALWFFRQVYQDMRTRLDRAETRAAELADTMRDQVVPALVASSEAVKACMRLIDDFRPRGGQQG